MSEKTAVEWLYEEFTKTNHLTEDEFYMKFKQAKEMEEEQHREQWHKGWQDAHDMVEHFREQGVTIITKNNEQTKQS